MELRLVGGEIPRSDWISVSCVGVSKVPISGDNALLKSYRRGSRPRDMMLVLQRSAVLLSDRERSLLRIHIFCVDVLVAIETSKS